MSARISVRECPECGAPINPQAITDPNNPVCPFCKTALPVTPDSEGAAVAALFTSGTAFRTATTATPFRSKRGYVGAAVVLVIFAVVVVLVISLGSKVKNALITPNYTISGAVLPVATDDGSKDIYVLARDAGSTSASTLRRVNPSTKAMVWEAAAVSTSSDTAPAAGPGQQAGPLHVDRRRCDRHGERHRVDQ